MFNCMVTSSTLTHCKIKLGSGCWLQIPIVQDLLVKQDE